MTGTKPSHSVLKLDEVTSAQILVCLKILQQELVPENTIKLVSNSEASRVERKQKFGRLIRNVLDAHLV